MKQSLQMRRVILSVGLSLFFAIPAGAWIPILTEDFSAPSGWTYYGVTNGLGQDLFRVDGGRLQAEWDAAYGLDLNLDPMTILTSTFSAPLGRTLTDADTFRVRVTLNLTSLKNRDFYQIASFGLFNPDHMGHDRTFIDDTWTFDGENWVPLFEKTTLVPNAQNLVEFNYFINEMFGGPSVQPNISADDETMVYGSNMRLLGNDALPTLQDIYAEVFYSADTRMARATIYSDAAYTEVLTINGIPVQEDSALALAVDKHFSLTHVGFFNYQAVDWEGSIMNNVGGQGSFANLSVEVIPEPATGGLFALAALGLALARRWRFAA